MQLNCTPLERKPNGLSGLFCECWRGRLHGTVIVGTLTWLPGVDRGCVDRAHDMHGVVLLDHLHRGAAVLGELVHVGAFGQPLADIEVAQAVEGMRLAVPVELDTHLPQNLVEQLDVIAWKDLVGGLGFVRDRSRLRRREGDGFL